MCAREVIDASASFWQKYNLYTDLEPAIEFYRFIDCFSWKTSMNYMKNWCFTKHQEKDGCLQYICTTRWLINPSDRSASGMNMSTQSLLKPGKQLSSCKQETSKNDGKMDSAFFTPEWYKSIGRTIRVVVSNNIPPPTSWTFGAFWWQVPSQTYPPEN